jgi:hypothetical protein
MSVSAFLQDIDRRWPWRGEGRICLRIIGSAALLLQTDYDRGTKDSDVLETAAITPEIRDGLLGLAGKGTDLHRTHRLYLEIVSEALPFLPHPALWHPLRELNRTLAHFDIEALDVTDVVVSKLKRFSASDVGDVRAMVEKDLVDRRRLVERFRLAVDTYLMDARAADLPRYIRNLNAVERDYLQEDETEIDLPDWI